MDLLDSIFLLKKSKIETANFKIVSSKLKIFPNKNLKNFIFYLIFYSYVKYKK